MRIERCQWSGSKEVAAMILGVSRESRQAVDVDPIADLVAREGDRGLIALTNRHDATEVGIDTVVVAEPELEAALLRLDSAVREALELASENARMVAEAQIQEGRTGVRLPQGQLVEVGSTPVASAGVYVPGGRRSYPSSLIMGAVPARVAGVGRVVVTSPPGPDGKVSDPVLAAAAICGVDEFYSVGGAQAIFAMARGTETIDPVEVIVGPGNDWVQEAKKAVFGEVGIDSPAGPSDITVVFGPDAEVGLLALDLCAQAEHGVESPLVAIPVGGADPDGLVREVERIAAESPTVEDCRLFVVTPPDRDSCVRLVRAIAPEHLELVGSEAEAMADEMDTAGCVFTGPWSATAFGDYVAGSNHILPTGGTGRIFGPLSPATFRRASARVTLDRGSAEALAGHVSTLSEVEGLPVHGLSASARIDPDRNRR